EPRPHSAQGPVLRRLADILPSAMPAAAEPSQAACSPGQLRSAAALAGAAQPTPSVQVERVLRAAVEILGGQRPARQLATVLRPELLNYLRELQAVLTGLQPRVRKVLSQQQSAGVLEAVALVTLSTGIRALAARFEVHLDQGVSRWRCTALQLRLTSGDLVRSGRR
ncbi:MAG TPA: Rv3235 family protein, partial [Pseudonocardiaceae bacterium]|nr:Rv3235 family protein [Pseudonocardiaceae bacterium]